MKKTMLAILTAITLVLSACGGEETDPNLPGQDDDITGTDGTPSDPNQCILDASKITVAVPRPGTFNSPLSIDGLPGAVSDPNPLHDDVDGCNTENGACIRIYPQKGIVRKCNSSLPESDGSLNIGTGSSSRNVTTFSDCNGQTVTVQAGDTITLVVTGKYCTEARADFVVQIK